jgi:hypothetical protein
MASQIGRLRPRGMRESGLTIDGDPQQSRSSSEVLIQPLANLIRYGFAISTFHSLYRLLIQNCLIIRVITVHSLLMIRVKSLGHHQVHYKGFVTRRGTLETLGAESPRKKFERVKIAG